MFDPTAYIVHDLSLTYNEKIAGYSSSPAKTMRQDGWNAQWLTIYSHAGTHMDAPLHFSVSPQTIDQYTPEMLMGKAWLIRIPITKAKQLIQPEDLSIVADKLIPGDSLLIHTNWSEKLGTLPYRNELPRISKELALWCVERQVRMLGVEPPSVADVNNLEEVTEIHQILLGGNVIIIEGLTHLDRIQSNSVFLIALPLKIAHGDGAPARVIALETK